MHWAKAVFSVFKEPGGAAATLPLMSSSSPTPLPCQWELEPRSHVENTDPEVNLLYHPWDQEMVHWCLFMKDAKFVQHNQALCQSHLWQRRWKLSPPGDFSVTQYGKWSLSAFHLLSQDANIGAVGTATSSGLPVCSGKFVWAINFTFFLSTFSQVLQPPLLPEDHHHLGPWCLTALILCAWKKN